MTSATKLAETVVGEPATEALGFRLAGGLRRGDLLALDGDLGAGKTALVRGLAAGLGILPALVRSPTFVLHHVYRGGTLVLHHLDCYRLGAGADLISLDLEEMLAEGVAAVEWAHLARPLDEFAPVRCWIDIPAPDRRIIRLAGDAPERLRVRFGDRQRGAPSR